MRTFCRAPRTVASIAPSSQALGQAVTSRLVVDESTQVLELGVGTGALTRVLMARGLGPHQYTGIERERHLVAALETRFPGLTFLHDSAENLRQILEEREIVPSQVVASLPWSTMGARARASCLSNIAESLGSGGQMLTYSYLSTLFLARSTRQNESDLLSHFRNVKRTGIIWRNLPPATVWSCSN